MPCTHPIAPRDTARGARRFARAAALVPCVALLCAVAAPRMAPADAELPPLPQHYSQAVCHALVMDAGRMIAWARWEQRLSLERVRAGPVREGTPGWVTQLVQGWITDAYQWQPTNDQIHQWAEELGSTRFLPRVEQLTKHETIAIWMRRIARGCPSEEPASTAAATDPIVAGVH